MYFNPSWSHAQSAFVVALFLWYWDRTRDQRTLRQWFILGLIGGLMMDMYYPNAIFLLVLAVEFAIGLAQRAKSGALGAPYAKHLIGLYAAFAGALVLAFSPTLITRRIIFGSFFATGYTEIGAWSLKNPLWDRVLFSADHGLFSWTPILLLASAGLLFLWRRNRTLAAGLLVTSVAFYILIATYPDWDGISSYGNRFFVSLTPVFVLGLASLLVAYEQLWRSRRAAVSSSVAVLGLLIAWNFGLIFQWGMHLIPDRGPISWTQMVSNQFRVVPADLSESLSRYFTGRHELMRQIEKQDLRQLGEIDPSPKTSRAEK
jgi:hypothetical protein